MDMSILFLRRCFACVFIGVFLNGIACESTGDTDSETDTQTSTETDTGSDTGTGTEDTGPVVDPDQEGSMCSNLGASTWSLAIAGEALGEGHSINAAGGLTMINLLGSGEKMGGFIEIVSGDKTPLVMLVTEDVPIEILNFNGDLVSNVEYSSESIVCPEANGRFVWIVENANNHLHFGPTNLSEVHIALEVVE